ncbi:Glu/Leu/Phe/Val family dehydrogenase [Ornithinimicrobium sp. Y1847]|uniref:Glu/Leu/Phe/Val family dehydrogenase n=1 Tax=unclassified Ornithinimicrobium TaxID=2615080 RepID=UPI003B6837C3
MSKDAHPDAVPAPDAHDPELFATEQVITCRDEELGLRAVIAIDNTTLGPSFGGVRWRPYPSTQAAVAEAQRLAQAMTLKHALAGLPYGGGKSVVIAQGPLPPTGSDERRRVMHRYGQFIARTGGTYIPGVDMGTTLEDMQAIREAGAQAYCADVDPGPYTATGVYAAMRAAVREVLDRDMQGVRVVVQGTGSVGAHLARYAAADGAEVLVADVDQERAAAVAGEIGGQVADPSAVGEAECDVFAPCAIARVLRAENVDRVRARIVCGAANDTLDTPEVAGLLGHRGIVYVPDFIANGGGVIQVRAHEVGWSEEELAARLEVIGDLVTQVLREADEQGCTPVDAALLIADQRLAAGRGEEMA